MIGDPTVPLWIGIMQGRLGPPEGGRFQSFPRLGWRREFERAAEAGLDGIEWIDDTYGEGENPLWLPGGLDELRAASARHGVALHSICADWFMEHPLLRCSDAERAVRLQRLAALIGLAAQLGIGRIVLPFVDNSRMADPSDADGVVAALSSVEPVARTARVELHLETDLDPRGFAALMARLPSDVFHVNYDSGNSSGIGYDPREEFAAYGDRVGSVHIKDRVRGGTTVALGTGSADFVALFDALRTHRYAGEFILQAARGEPGDEVALARHNRAFTEAAAGRRP